MCDASRLDLLNRELINNITGTGYLSIAEGETVGIPEVSEITEQLWYACKFWIDHILEVGSPVPNELVGVLRNVMSTWLILWMEVITSNCTFPGLQSVTGFRWEILYLVFRFFSYFLQTTVSSDCNIFDVESQTWALRVLSFSLSYMDRRELWRRSRRPLTYIDTWL